MEKTTKSKQKSVNTKIQFILTPAEGEGCNHQSIQQEVEDLWHA